MKDGELWKAAVGQVQKEYLALPDRIRAELAEALAAVAELKGSIAAIAAADDECRRCGGACCRFGRHHFTVVDLLGYLHAGTELFQADFESQVCPYHSGSGCMMPAPLRPYNCIIFICEAVECRLDAESLSRLTVMEATLKELYSNLDNLLGNRFANGLLITYERSLVSGRVLFRY